MSEQARTVAERIAKRARSGEWSESQIEYEIDAYAAEIWEEAAQEAERWIGLEALAAEFRSRFAATCRIDKRG